MPSVDRLPHPRLLEQRVALRADLDVDVLLREARDRAVRQPGLALELRESGLRGRVDRVDLAAAHGLDLGVRVRDHLEVELLQARLLAVPVRGSPSASSPGPRV